MIEISHFYSFLLLSRWLFQDMFGIDGITLTIYWTRFKQVLPIIGHTFSSNYHLSKQNGNIN